MPPTPRSPKAVSRYKQVRLQFTEEVGGRVSATLYVKPLNAAWNEHQVVQRWSREHGPNLHTLEDVLGLMIDLLEEDCLPGIG